MRVFCKYTGQIVVFVCLFLGFSSRIQAKEADDLFYRDSIIDVAKRISSDTARLAYWKDIAYFHQYAPLDSFFAIRLYEEGRRQGSLFYENEGAYYMACCFDRRHQPDSLAYWVGKLKQMAEKLEMYDYYLEQKAAISRAQASKRMIEKAVYTAKEVLKEALLVGSRNGEIAAYNSLGCAYTVSSRSGEALEVLLKAYNRFTEQTKATLRVDVLSRIAGIYGNSGRDSLRMPYLEEMNRILQERLAQEPETKSNWANMLVDCEVKYILHYINRSDFHAVREHIKKAKALLDDHVDPVFWLNVQLVQLQYYSKAKEYDKSIALVDEVTPIVLKNYVSTFGMLINHKSITQKAKGDIEGAIRTRRYLIRAQDSLNNAFSESQLKQVKELYHIDELLLEKQRINNTNLINILTILIILSILILLFELYTRRLSHRIAAAEKAAAEAAVQSEVDNRAKERLRTEISHDVRTPLNAVVGFAELLTSSENPLDEASKVEYSRIIQENAEQLLDYVNNILELSRLESGKVKYEEEVCELIGLCRDAITIACHMEENAVRPLLDTSLEKAIACSDRKAFLALLKSALIVPAGKGKKYYPTLLRIEMNEDRSHVIFHILNTPLAEESSENKTALIRNEINTYFLRYFGGSYEVFPAADEGPTIVFVYPLLPEK